MQGKFVDEYMNATLQHTEALSSTSSFSEDFLVNIANHRTNQLDTRKAPSEDANQSPLKNNDECRLITPKQDSNNNPQPMKRSPQSSIVRSPPRIPSSPEPQCQLIIPGSPEFYTRDNCKRKFNEVDDSNDRNAKFAAVTGQPWEEDKNTQEKQLDGNEEHIVRHESESDSEVEETEVQLSYYPEENSIVPNSVL